METKSIYERAKAIAEEWKKDIIRGGEDISFTHLEYVAKQAATEQDRIARAEEREKAELNFCIVCNNYDYCEQRYDCKLFNKFSKAMKE